MRPVLFHWRGRPVSSYAAMLYVGIVVGLAVGNVVARANALPSGRVYVATLLLLPLALLGARVAYVLGHLDEFRADRRLMFRRSVGGQAMLGGLVAVPVSVPLLAALDVPFWGFWDVATFTMLAGMVFARVGCLLTGCCAGRPTDARLGLVLPDHRGVRRRRVPTQLLEAAVAVGLLAMAAVLNARRLAPGSVFLLVLGAYAGIRIALQGLRDSEARLGRISMQRTAAASLAGLVLVAIAVRGI